MTVKPMVLSARFLHNQHNIAVSTDIVYPVFMDMNHTAVFMSVLMEDLFIAVGGNNCAQRISLHLRIGFDHSIVEYGISFSEHG